MERKSDGSENGKKISDETERYLAKIYYDTRNPASYIGIEKLYNYVKKQGIKKFLNHKLEYGSVNKNLILLIDLLEDILNVLVC